MRVFRTLSRLARTLRISFRSEGYNASQTLVFLFLTVAVTASMSGWALAQPPRGPRGGPGGPGGPGALRPEVLERIVDDLHLSPGEKEKVDAIVAAHEAKMRQARDES